MPTVPISGAGSSVRDVPEAGSFVWVPGLPRLDVSPWDGFLCFLDTGRGLWGPPVSIILGPLGSLNSHHNLFCRKALLPFGSHDS